MHSSVGGTPMTAQMTGAASAAPVTTPVLSSPKRYEWTHIDMCDRVMEEYDPSRHFIVDGLMSSTATLVSGLPESQKSTFTLHMMKAISSEPDFLGRAIYGGPHRVFWIGGDPGWDEELDDSALRGLPNVHRIAADNPNVSRLASPDRVTAADAWEDLAAYVSRLGVTVIVVDGLTAFAGGNGLDKVGEVQPFFGCLNQFIHRGIAVVLIAHAPKGSGTGRNPGKPLGSTAITGWRRVGIEVMGDGTSGGFRTIRVMGNRVRPSTLTFSMLTPFEIALASDQPVASGAEPAPRPKKADRDYEVAVRRAQALLAAPRRVLGTDSSAGAWLAMNDPEGRIHSEGSGRKTVAKLRHGGFLKEESGIIVAGPLLNPVPD